MNGTSGASWFETALTRLLTMRVHQLEERSLSARPASIPPNLFHSATVMRSRLKLWNESGTKRARIADSYPNPIRSPQHLALKRLGRHYIKFTRAPQAAVWGRNR